MAVGRGFSQALSAGYDTMDRALEVRDRDRLRRELGEAGRADQVEGIGNIRQNPDAPYVEGQEEGPQYAYDKNFQLGGQSQAARFTPDQVNQYRMDRMADVYARNGRADEAVRMRGASQQSRAAGIQLESAQSQLDQQRALSALQAKYQAALKNPSGPEATELIFGGLGAYNRNDPNSQYDDGQVGMYDPATQQFTLMSKNGQKIRDIPMAGLPPDKVQEILRHGYMAMAGAISPEMFTRMQELGLKTRTVGQGDQQIAETGRSNRAREALTSQGLGQELFLGDRRLSLLGTQINNDNAFNQGRLRLEGARVDIAKSQANDGRWEIVGRDAEGNDVLHDRTSRGSMVTRDGRPPQGRIDYFPRVTGQGGSGTGVRAPRFLENGTMRDNGDGTLDQLVPDRNAPNDPSKARWVRVAQPSQETQQIQSAAGRAFGPQPSAGTPGVPAQTRTPPVTVNPNTESGPGGWARQGLNWMLSSPSDQADYVDRRGLAYGAGRTPVGMQGDWFDRDDFRGGPATGIRFQGGPQGTPRPNLDWRE